MAVDQVRIGRDNFSYIIYDESSKKAAIVDPGFGEGQLEKEIRSRDLSVEYIILTHHHADHTAGAVSLRNFYGARILAHEKDALMIRGVDLTLFDGEIIKIGEVDVEIVHTPGHTPGGICLLVEKKFILTGDTLFIDECGRCDLPGSSLSDMFHSLKKLGSLPDELVVYPGHDYGPKPSDTLGNQKRTNYTMKARSVEEFSGL
jgi:hydroxyacylglutathione hydrolase